MANCITGTFTSSTGQTLDKRLWLPEGAPKGIVQFVHGMAEHMDRYDAPARALCDGGYMVVGHTHLGHGPKAATLGYFADNHGWDRLLDDIHLLRQETERAYPGVPYLGLWQTARSDAAFLCVEPWYSLPARSGVIEDLATQPSLLSLASGKAGTYGWSLTVAP